MSLDIFVMRGAGDRRGEDIVDPLIGSSIPVAIQRGRNELDGRAKSPHGCRRNAYSVQGSASASMHGSMISIPAKYGMGKL